MSTTATCAACLRGQPEWDGMIACTLGWKQHEEGGHPGLPLPVLAPQTGCMAKGGNRWTPQRKVRP